MNIEKVEFMDIDKEEFIDIDKLELIGFRLRSESTQLNIFKYETDDRVTFYSPSGDFTFVISYLKEHDFEKPKTLLEKKIPTICTKTELAKYLNVSVSTIDNLRREGIIRAIKMGKGTKVAVRFNLEDVLEDLQKKGRNISTT